MRLNLNCFQARETIDREAVNKILSFFTIQPLKFFDITKLIVTIFFVMTNIVSFSRALADATRWRIVRLVLDDALCVCELADILEMPQSTISSHVQIIRKAGLLESEKCEKWTYFQIEPKHRKLIATLEKFFEPDDAVLKTDFARSLQRLTQRENSCCPGPRNLKTKRR
jgi:ArsR family transcriptional regulator, arsenate/arsenite/antimonite-responsive transcriptional repressor